MLQIFDIQHNANGNQHKENIMHKLTAIAKLGIGLAAFTFLLAGCGGGGGSSSSAAAGGAVDGVATPSKVSIVNTN